MEQTMAKDLTQGSVLRQLMLFALPIALANILQIVYTVVDTIMIGRFIGTAGISAVTSAGRQRSSIAAMSAHRCRRRQSARGCR